MSSKYYSKLWESTYDKIQEVIDKEHANQVRAKILSSAVAIVCADFILFHSALRLCQIQEQLTEFSPTCTSST